MGKKIKFMGSAHVQLLEKGENFGGRLAEGLSKDVTWNQGNDWIIDSEDAGLTDVQVDQILSDSDYFKDVTELERIPLNEHQKIFLAMQESTHAREDVATLRDADRAAAAAATEGDAEEKAPEGESKPEGDDPAQGSDDTATTTTTGGSTRRTRGG